MTHLKDSKEAQKDKRTLSEGQYGPSPNNLIALITKMYLLFGSNKLMKTRWDVPGSKPKVVI